MGNHDLIVSFYTKDIRLFWSKWFDFLKQYKLIVNEYFVNVIVEKNLFPFFYEAEKRVENSFEVGNKEKQQFDEVDEKLIEMLNENCRRPIHEMANILELKSSSIIYRIKNLERKKLVLGYYTIFDFSKIGKDFCRVQFQFSDLNKFDPFLESLKVLPSILSYAKLLGSSYDLEVDFLVENLEELLKELKNLKTKFPGLIRNYDYLRVIDTFKWNHNPLY